LNGAKKAKLAGFTLEYINYADVVIGQVTRRTRQSFAVVTLPRGVTTRQGHAGQAPLGHPARSEAELPGQQ